MLEDTKLTVEDCKEILDDVIEESDDATDELYLWKELRGKLMNKLGEHDNPQFDFFYKPATSTEPDTPDMLIAQRRAEILKILEKHSDNPQPCMEIFDKLRTTK